MLADLLAHLTREPIIDSVAWTCGNDASLDGSADEGHVSDDVEQLVAGALVLPHQRLVLHIAQVGSVAVLNMQHVGQHVETLLCGLTLVNDDGVVEIAALDEVGLQQRLEVAHEDKGTCRSYLLSILVDIVEGGKLAVDELRLEAAHRGERELVVGQDGDARAVLLVLHLYLLADDVVVLGSVLLFDAHLLNLLYKLDGRAVEDGELRAADLYEAVVDAQSVEGAEAVLHGADAYVALAEDGAALCVDHILGYSVDGRHPFEVDALNLITMILRSRIESDSEAQSGMKAFSAKGEAAFQSFLFHIDLRNVI